jgi:DNA-binding SARP family transcriptional activator
MHRPAGQTRRMQERQQIGPAAAPAATVLEFRILGPVEVHDRGGLLAVTGTKLHTVLAKLLLAEGRVVAGTELSALLWGCDPPVTWSAQIYTYVSRLRGLVAPAAQISRRPPGYLLRLGPATLDYHRFEVLVRHGRHALDGRQFAQAAGHYREALALWRGPALATVTEFMVLAEQPRLDEARVNALEERIAADLSLGGNARLVPELVRLVDAHPFREGFRAQLMTALYRADRQGEAITTYHRFRRLLAEELGVDPGPRLRETFQSVIEGTLPLHAGRAGSVSALSAIGSSRPLASAERTAKAP